MPNLNCIMMGFGFFSYPAHFFVQTHIKKYCKTVSLGIFILSLLLLDVKAHAGEIEPRSYVNTPVGINFLLAGYAYSEGGLSTDAASPLKDAEIEMHTGLFAYARSLDILGKSGKIDVVAPYSDLSGNAMVNGERIERNVSGFFDPRFRFSVNLLGAPALSLKDFANYQQDLIIGTSLQVSAPLGYYESEKLVNLGNNRWFFKPDIGISKAIGPITLELSAGALFFTRNDNFFGGKTLDQDPVYTTQLHATYLFGKGIWGALSGTYDFGGQTTVDKVDKNDSLDNSRIGATLALPVNKNNSIKLYASTGIYTHSGNDYNLGGVVWQYRWGSGL